MDSMTKQRREGEANGPLRAKTGQRKLRKPSWTEFVRLADQAVVAIAGADMINRAEPRACGYSRGPRGPETSRAVKRMHARAASNGAGNGLGRGTADKGWGFQPNRGRPAIRNE